MADRPIEVRMPLFDRLVDRAHSRVPHDKVPVRTIDRGLLKESVRRELEQLFNTRCPTPAHLLGTRPRTVIDYGIPDFSTISARNFDDRKRLEAMLRSAIEAYEPRLSDVRVVVEVMPGNDFVLRGYIAGYLIVDGVPEAVLFPTLMQMRDATVEVRS